MAVNKTALFGSKKTAAKAAVFKKLGLITKPNLSG
jgi:hypothetical protein